MQREEEAKLTISGFPSPAADYKTKPLSLDDYLIDYPLSTFFFRFQSDMYQAASDFQNGDVLVVDRSKKATKKVKYAVVEKDGSFLLFDAKNIAQEKENQKSKSYNNESSIKLFGIVTGLVRKF
jgi:SOS-response transcriptional repressor LexA